MWKECKALILPTKKAEIGTIMKYVKYMPLHNFQFDARLGELVLNKNPSVTCANDYWQPQQIYITSDDEISDWYINPTNDDGFIIQRLIGVNHGPSLKEQGCEKIISTSNTSLTKIVSDFDFLSDSSGEIEVPALPQLPQQFIKAFITEYNKHVAVTKSGQVYLKVFVEHEANCSCSPKCNFPFEKGNCRQRNSGVEQLKINPDNTINIKFYLKDSWTREEILQDIELAMINGLDLGQYRDKWIA